LKAIVYRTYGSADVVRLEDVEEPIVGDNEVLIKVRAASINPFDWHFMRGTPYMLRLQAGLTKPKRTRLGVDVAGDVRAIGRKVTQLKVGDEVFGSCSGAFAEYVTTAEAAVAAKPTNTTFEQAAAVPVAGYTALQALRDRGQIEPGRRVLINGASGGVGTFAVQIAKAFGAHVTGVCSTKNVDMVRSIGADRVIDYTRENFTTAGERYDLVLDCVGNHSLSACRRVLTSTGIYVAVGGPTGRWMIGFIARVLAGMALSRFGRQKFALAQTKTNKADLHTLAELIEGRKVGPVIDRRYTLVEVPEAIRYLEGGHARGKVVITIA
jgi:NADPH:quinone reductase-like Zn-dependent oxidoreductase